jgi:hypothetical protein
MLCTCLQRTAKGSFVDVWRLDGMLPYSREHPVNALDAKYATQASWLLMELECPLHREQWLAMKAEALRYEDKKAFFTIFQVEPNLFEASTIQLFECRHDTCSKLEMQAVLNIRPIAV